MRRKKIPFTAGHGILVLSVIMVVLILLTWLLIMHPDSPPMILG